MKTKTRKFLRFRYPDTLNMDSHIQHLIAGAFLETNGNITDVGPLLGISRRTLHRYLLKWPHLRYARNAARLRTT